MNMPPLPITLDQELALRLLQDMLRIRRLEEKAAELYGAGKIRGFLHLYVGEEAVAAGAFAALSRQDTVVSTYREHGHALLHGIPMGAIMAEMYGKQEGCSRGRGGSMHLFDVSRRFYGGNAIVGGGLPMAVGLALADQMRGIPRVTACFFGDGAVAEGVFHESLNLAALWHLPVLFCCENNLYAMGTALERAQSQTNLSAKAASFRIPSEAVDGMDVAAVYQSTCAALEQVRREQGPFFLEFRTYRFRAHSMFDPDLYRSKSEIAHWKERDPIPAFSARLQAMGWLDEARGLQLDAEASCEVAEAVAFAEAGRWEPVERLLEDVYTLRGIVR